MQSNAVGSSSSTSSSKGGDINDRLRSLDMDVFLKLMIAELTNQDPMNPMDNAQMLNQLNQIHEITSNDRLSDTLDAVLTGNNLSTATSMIGKRIRALSDASTEDSPQYVTGVVDRVSIEEGKVRLSVGPAAVDLNNVAEILPPE